MKKASKKEIEEIEREMQAKPQVRTAVNPKHSFAG
jgi:hypothetical protein